MTANILIFVGHFGSGKTEMAINYAIKKAKEGKKTILVDLDIVNPFFCSSEVKKQLESYDIEVITPNFANKNIDVPSLSPRIQSVFNKKNAEVILDVGGDEDGATVLGAYKQYLDKVNYNMYFVINTKRPFTQKVNDIINIMKAIELKSRQKITHLVSNTNLSYETTLDIIKEGIPIVEEVSKKTGLPISYINIPSNLKANIKDDFNGKEFIMDLYMNRWNVQQ